MDAFMVWMAWLIVGGPIITGWVFIIWFVLIDFLEWARELVAQCGQQRPFCATIAKRKS